jgi:hypothetical protein
MPNANGPSDRRLWREIWGARQAFKDYQLEAGQWVQWFRFNKPGTTANPIYDTGPQRVWYPAITLPVMLAEQTRASQNFDDDGLYLVSRLHLIFSYYAFFQTTMPDPDPYGQDHVNDRVGFDTTLFSVDSFIPHGRVAGQWLTVSCDLTEVASEDLAEDVPAPMFAPYVVAS